MLKKILPIALALSFSGAVFAGSAQINTERLSDSQISFLTNASENILKAPKALQAGLVAQYNAEAQNQGIQLPQLPAACAAAVNGFGPLIVQAISAMATRPLPTTTAVMIATGVLNAAIATATGAAAAPIYNDGCDAAVMTGLGYARAALSSAIVAYNFIH